MKTRGLGNRIRSYRKAKGMTLKELARITNTSISFLSDIERGRSKPSVDRLTDIANALDVPISKLITNRETSVKEDISEYYFEKSGLPTEARKELELFIEFLKFKFKSKK